MVADCCVYARVGCQQNPLIVRSQSKRMESYAGIRHTLQLSMVFGSRVSNTSLTVYRFVTAGVYARRKLPVGLRHYSSSWALSA